MKKIIHCCLLLISLIEVNTSYAQPVISSFSPESGVPGAFVLIKGKNFSDSTSGNIVYFGATRAIVDSATPTSLIVTIPSGATTQPITVTVNHLIAYSSIPFNVTSSAGTVSTFTSASFQKVLDLVPISNPRSAVIADFNNDGKPDLAVTNQSSTFISVFKNISLNDSILFDNPLSVFSGQGPFNMTIADFNGDGMLDLGVTNFNSGNASTASLLINTSKKGNISFVASTSLNYSSGNGTIGIASSDLNNDGKVDFVVCSGNSGIFSVFQNSSSSVKHISFLPKHDYNYYRAQDVSISDVDNDGKQEVLITNQFSSKVAVFDNFSNEAGIALVFHSDYATGSFANNISIADVNLDKKPDLVISSYIDFIVSILKNNSSQGAISFAGKVDFPTGNNPERSAVSDLDGDGKPDVAVANEQSNTISVIKNVSTKSTVSFLGKVDYATGFNPTSVVIGDLNGDGKPDLVVTNSTSGTVSIYKNFIGSQIIAYLKMPGILKNTF